MNRFPYYGDDELSDEDEWADPGGRDAPTNYIRLPTVVDVGQPLPALPTDDPELFTRLTRWGRPVFIRTALPEGDRIAEERRQRDARAQYDALVNSREQATRMWQAAYDEGSLKPREREWFGKWLEDPTHNVAPQWLPKQIQDILQQPRHFTGTTVDILKLLAKHLVLQNHTPGDMLDALAAFDSNYTRSREHHWDIIRQMIAEDREQTDEMLEKRARARHFRQYNFELAQMLVDRDSYYK